MPCTFSKSLNSAGFTLIELSIVLVIIGLVTGGVLVGRDLIDAAAIRAQISQIEKYQTAVNTFRGKYGYLPGDMPDPTATQYGFQPRGSAGGQGDGNGIIEDFQSGYDQPTDPLGQCEGETGVFWNDLSTAGLIDGGFNKASETSTCLPYNMTDPTQIALFIPKAKLGNSLSVFVWSGGAALTIVGPLPGWNHRNYFGLAQVTALNCGGGGWGAFCSNPTMTVQQAYAIDKKIDDGLPLLGKVQALLAGGNGYQAGGAGYDGPNGAVPGQAFPNTIPSSCYDNGNNASSPFQYTLNPNAALQNCALSFEFQ